MSIGAKSAWPPAYRHALRSPVLCVERAKPNCIVFDRGGFMADTLRPGSLCQPSAVSTLPFVSGNVQTHAPAPMANSAASEIPPARP